MKHESKQKKKKDMTSTERILWKFLIRTSQPKIANKFNMVETVKDWEEKF